MYMYMYIYICIMYMYYIYMYIYIKYIYIGVSPLLENLPQYLLPHNLFKPQGIPPILVFVDPTK